MTLKSIIQKIGNHTPQDFIAPIPTASTTRVFTLQNGIPYWFAVNVSDPGWYFLTPNAPTIEVIREIEPYERIEYLAQLPRFLVIALWPTSESTWLVSPFNLSDASQRAWANGEPRFCYLVSSNIQSLDILAVRRMGDILLFEDVVSSVQFDNHAPGLFYAKSIINARLLQLQREEQKRLRKEQLETEEGRIQTSLEMMGAQLRSWERNVQGYTVKWDYDGREYSMPLDQNLHVRSAGVCLDDTDYMHSLASIVAVMEDSYNERGY
jgi:hypothetical protein